MNLNNTSSATSTTSQQQPQRDQDVELSVIRAITAAQDGVLGLDGILRSVNGGRNNNNSGGGGIVTQTQLVRIVRKVAQYDGRKGGYKLK